MNPRLRPFRAAALVFAAACLVLLLAACQESGGAPAEEGETIAVTLAPSLAAGNLGSQGIPGGLGINDVLVFVRRGPLGDCLVFDNDGFVDDGVTSPTTDECAISIWDGSAVDPAVLNLPSEFPDGSPANYDFFLNVRETFAGTGGEDPTTVDTAAFASERIEGLSDPVTLRFQNLVTMLIGPGLQTANPLDTTLCPDPVREVLAGDVVPIYLVPLGEGKAIRICRERAGNSSTMLATLVPFTDFGIGPVVVTLNGVDISDTSGLFSGPPSKRGFQFEVPAGATVGDVFDFSLPVTGYDFGYAEDSAWGLVDSAPPVSKTATYTLDVVAPPVPTGIDPDLVAPEIASVNTSTGLGSVTLVIGPTSDPADVADVVAFLGVQQIALEVTNKTTQTGSSGVVYSARICSDFARFFPTGGETGTNLDLTFYATDPTGNQSAPFTHPITVNTLYSGPNSACENTSTL